MRLCKKHQQVRISIIIQLKSYYDKIQIITMVGINRIQHIFLWFFQYITFISANEKQYATLLKDILEEKQHELQVLVT